MTDLNKFRKIYLEREIPIPDWFKVKYNIIISHLCNYDKCTDTIMPGQMVSISISGKVYHRKCMKQLYT